VLELRFHYYGTIEASKIIPKKKKINISVAYFSEIPVGFKLA
jgi:hypothetical protein